MHASPAVWIGVGLDLDLARGAPRLITRSVNDYNIRHAHTIVLSLRSRLNQRAYRLGM